MADQFNVGGISYTLSVDTGALIRAQRDTSKASTDMKASLTAVSEATQIHIAATKIAAVAIREVTKAENDGAAAAKKLAGATDESSTSLQKNAISAGQLVAATRNLPAQFTDIVTSLQAGQSPLTVLLQQGGQIKDMFGGIGPAAKAMGTYVAGLVSPLTAAAAAAAALFLGFIKGREETAELNKTVELSGHAAGVTADQLNTLAARMDNLAGVTRGQAAEALMIFATAGVQGRDGIAKVTEAAIRLQQVGGPAIDETAKAFKALADDPVAASLKLNESVNHLTTSVYLQITSLEEQGKHIEAVRVAQEAYADAILQRTPQIQANLGYIERGWNAVKNAAREAWDGILNIGRGATPEEQLASTRKRIAELQQQIETGGFSTTAGGAATGRGMGQKELAEKTALLEALKEQVRTYERAQAAAEGVAQTDAKRKAAVEAMAQFDKDGEKFLDKRAKMEREIAVAKQQGITAGLSEEKIQERIAAIKASYKDKGGSDGKIDEEAYLASFAAKAAATELEKISIMEEAALQANNARYEKGKISFETAEKAKTLIVAGALQARRALQDKAEKDETLALFRQSKEDEERQKKIDDAKEKARDHARKVTADSNPATKVMLWSEEEQARNLAAYTAGLIDAETAAAAKVAIAQQTAQKLKAISDKQTADASQAAIGQLNNYSNLFGGLASLAETFSGKQSSTYKALFATQKAFSIASSMIAIYNGISLAAAQPFPENLAAMSTVASATAGLVSQIQSVNYGGGRQYGGSVNAGSLYRINETGESEVYTANNGKQYFLPTSGGEITPANEVGASSGSSGGSGTTNNIDISVQVLVQSDGSTSSETKSSGTDQATAKALGERMAAQAKQTMVEELRPGGLLWKLKNGQA